MKSIHVNKNSWHARLISSMHPHWEGFYLSDTNICSYTKKLFSCLLTGFFQISTITFFLSCIIDFLIWAYVSLVYYHTDVRAGLLAIIGFHLFTIGTFLILACFGESLLCRYDRAKFRLKKSNEAPKEPNFLVEMYKAFKGKYCVKIDFIE
jgi:hypothetical protein